MRRSSMFHGVDHVNMYPCVPPPLSIAQDREGSPWEARCLCMARAPVPGQRRTKTHRVGDVEEVPPWMSYNHTAQAGQYDIVEARTA